MNKTRIKILSVSKKMFNEQGFYNVTIRMIALKLSMSSGNLNYHFKKREDILEALYFEMVEAFDTRVKELGSKEITLASIKEDILLSLKRMVEYRFFWTDLYNLLRINKNIKTHFEEAYKVRFEGYELLFKILKTKGILKDFEFENESFLLIQRMIVFSNTWLYNSLLYNEEINSKFIELQCNNLLAILYPYFTELGKLKHKEITLNT